jgi:hypothetical protein
MRAPNNVMLLLLLMVLVLGQTYIIAVQGQTITQQRTLIREMVKNPNCMIP